MRARLSRRPTSPGPQRTRFGSQNGFQPGRSCSGRGGRGMADICECPHCGRRLRVPLELHGRRVRCVSCATVFVAGESAVDVLPEAAKERPAPNGYAMKPEPSPEADREGEARSVRRPRPAHWEDDEEDDRPRRRSRPRELPGQGLTLALAILLAVDILLSLGAVALSAAMLQDVQVRNRPVQPLVEAINGPKR